VAALTIAVREERELSLAPAGLSLGGDWEAAY